MGTDHENTDLEVVNLQFTYPPGQEFQFAGGCCTGRLSSLIRVATDSGTWGIGSVYSHPELVRAIVEGQLRDLLVGDDPLEVESILEKSYRVTRWYGRKDYRVTIRLGALTASRFRDGSWR